MYKIILDSCGELMDDMKADSHFSSVPLELEVDGLRIIDDDTFDQKDFLERMKASKKEPKSSCPSPECYMKEFETEAKNIYVITLSAKLSGSYNSAVLATNLYKDEEGEGKNIHVFNSKSASIGETLIALKIQELEDAKLSFEKVVEQVEDYISEQRTFFVLESLETLRKAGRISNAKALVAQTLNIKPVMGSTPEGEICKLGQTRGMKKALSQMVEEMIKVTENCENKVAAISHCNSLERALYVKELIEKLAKFKKIIILDTRGISTMYANDGGIILAV